MSSVEGDYDYEGLSTNAGLTVRIRTGRLKQFIQANAFPGAYVSWGIGE